MTANRRIVLNIIATYGRSLFALVCGLFSGRWALMALGEVDYGLFGVVGGLTAFIAFFNGVLSFSISRFYAAAVGQAAKMAVEGVADEGIEICRKWFSIAVIIHTVIPVVLMIVGYPIGEWAIRYFLTIPQEKVIACVWVFRFVCISCFIGMASVPFNAMYQAKQYIAELTIYSVVTTAANVCFLYYMVTHPMAWLSKYALWTCFLSVAPQVIIAVRAVKLFPECRFRMHYWKERTNIVELFKYAGWQLFGSSGTLFRVQAMQVLVNKYFGPAVNTSVALANTVSGHTKTLSVALIGAFQPAIATAFGAGDMERFKSLSFKACRFSALFSLIFMLPLALEIHEVMVLWLKEPPRYVDELCLCMLIVYYIDSLLIGYELAVNACGRVAAYQILVGGSMIAIFPISWLMFSLGMGPVWIGYVTIIMALVTATRVIIARRVAGLSFRYWLFKVAIPINLVVVLNLFVGYLPKLFIDESFLRVILTTIVVDVGLVTMFWFFVLDAEEKAICVNRIKSLICSFRQQNNSECTRKEFREEKV